VVSGFVQDHALLRPFIAECNAARAGYPASRDAKRERRPAVRGFRVSGVVVDAGGRPVA
jgi:hypothetical protein